MSDIKISDEELDMSLDKFIDWILGHDEQELRNIDFRKAKREVLIAAQAHTNSEITAVLNRLEQKSVLLVEQDPVGESYQETNYVPLSAIEAERKRL